MVIGIVGLGLMGGSFALALKDVYKDGVTIIGTDHNTNHLKDAKDLNLIDKILPYDELKKISDVIIFAIPVKAIKKELSLLKDIKKDCTIIDLGSTKQNIINSINPKFRQNLVASHPMAGTEYSGPKAAFKTLYKDKIVVICDIENSGKTQANQAVKIFSKIGMKIVYMKANEHDRHAAFISHMPHIISYSLANSVLSQEDKKNILTLAAGGFRDMSRLAKSSPKMWKDIFEENKEILLESLNSFENEFKTAKTLIEHEKWEELYLWLKKANSLYEIFC
jgi:prephenate dehydrogenase